MRLMKNSAPEYFCWVDEVIDSSMIEYSLKLPLEEADEEWEFLGKKLPKDLAIKVAEGEVNPVTFGEYDDSCLEKLRYKK